MPSPLPSSIRHAADVTDGQVEAAVAGEVTGHDGTFESRGDCLRRLECAVAVAQQYLHAIAGTDGQVEAAIAVEVTGHHGTLESRGDCLRRLECPVAVAQQYLHATLVADGEVEPPVAVEITRHNTFWKRPNDVRLRCLECAVALVQQHRDVVVVEVCRGQVEAAVAGEVSGYQIICVDSRLDDLRAWNVPSPLPSSMEMSPKGWLVTARSRRPSPVKSPATSVAWPATG